MISRNKVRINFIVKDVFSFSATCIANVKIDEDTEEILDYDYCKEIEDFEDVEFIEMLEEVDENYIPEESEIYEDDIQEITYISLI